MKKFISPFFLSFYLVFSNYASACLCGWISTKDLKEHPEQFKVAFRAFYRSGNLIKNRDFVMIPPSMG